MKSFDIIEFAINPEFHLKLRPAAPEESFWKGGSTIAACCGSQLVLNVTEDRGNYGVTCSRNDYPVSTKQEDDALFTAFDLGDGTYLNFKFRTSP